MDLCFDAGRKDLSLYEMKPHNISFPHQALSLMLGMAVLTDEAASYPGGEDVFTKATMSERQYQPKFFAD